MVVIPRNSSDAEILSIVREWIDVLARNDYEAVYQALGYACAYGQPGAECIRDQIHSYRSAKLFPGVTHFAVTDWRKAQGGNISPIHVVTRYKPNSSRIAGAIDFHLPLNGRWSDLLAAFVFIEPKTDGEDFYLSLEDISLPPSEDAS